MLPRRLILRAVLLPASIAACRSVAPQSRPTVSPIPVARFRSDSSGFSAFSGLRDSVRLIIRDDVGWREVWRRIHSPFIPAPPVPPIDFAREMIVLASLGTRPSSGYDIIIQTAQRDAAGIEVLLRRSNPGPGCAVAAVVTQPVDLARIAVSDLPVRFAERITTATCGVP
jgi:hypothetical protein